MHENNKPQKTLMQLMVWANVKLVNDLLPPPLTVGQINDHDTGCQASILASSPEMPTIEVWRDSVWKNSRYEFNEIGKVRGIQPGCEWAKDAIDRLYASLLARYEEHCMQRECAKSAAADEDARKLADAHLHYAAMLKAAE